MPSSRRAQVGEARLQARELQTTIDKLRREATERERVLAEREQRFVSLRRGGSAQGWACIYTCVCVP